MSIAAISHSTQTPLLTLTYSSTEHPGASFLCIISRYNRRAQSQTATLQTTGIAQRNIASKEP
jgi:hypothetical protein